MELFRIYVDGYLLESDNIDLGGDDDELDPSLGESRKKTWNSKLWEN